MSSFTPPPPAEGYDPDDYENMVEICWESLTDGNVCALPILDRHTTYAECCCLFGVAWGNQCALCPTRTSGRPLGHRPSPLHLSHSHSSPNRRPMEF